MPPEMLEVLKSTLGSGPGVATLVVCIYVFFKLFLPWLDKRDLDWREALQKIVDEHEKAMKETVAGLQHTIESLEAEVRQLGTTVAAVDRGIQDLKELGLMGSTPGVAHTRDTRGGPR